MKNITVSVEDEVYLRARAIAAERKMSVSALVRQALGQAAAQETEFERLARMEFRVVDRLRARGAS